MKVLSAFFLPNPKSHFLQPGSISFIPGWIWLLFIILGIGMTWPKIIKERPLFFAFIIGSLMPTFDDLFAFVFGPPFAHHSVFHSLLLGPPLTYALFYFLSNTKVAKYALLGDIVHIAFNFSLDYVALFFPISYQEFGLTDIFHVSTYGLKIIFYPVILLFFWYSVIRYFLQFKKSLHQ